MNSQLNYVIDNVKRESKEQKEVKLNEHYCRCHYVPLSVQYCESVGNQINCKPKKMKEPSCNYLLIVVEIAIYRRRINIDSIMSVLSFLLRPSPVPINNLSVT